MTMTPAALSDYDELRAHYQFVLPDDDEMINDDNTTTTTTNVYYKLCVCRIVWRVVDN